MLKDHRLYELSDAEFEGLVLQICVRWLGQGVTPFAPGRDGGRDAKFHGTATSFPSSTAPHVGHFVVQAKHVNERDRSCSDADFARLLKREYPKVRRLSSPTGSSRAGPTRSSSGSCTALVRKLHTLWALSGAISPSIVTRKSATLSRTAMTPCLFGSIQTS